MDAVARRALGVLAGRPHGKVYLRLPSAATLYALDAENGHDVWHIDTAGEVKAGVAYHDGTVYVGDYARRHVRGRRRPAGRSAGTRPTSASSFGRSGRFYATPAVAYGRVYVGNVDGRVYSFEASSGDIAWTHSTGGAVYAAPAVADTPGTPPDRLHRLGRRQLLRARRQHGDTIVDRTASAASITGSASVIGDVVYVSDSDTSGPSARVDDGHVVYEVDLRPVQPRDLGRPRGST